MGTVPKERFAASMGTVPVSVQKGQPTGTVPRVARNGQGWGLELISKLSSRPAAGSRNRGQTPRKQAQERRIPVSGSDPSAPLAPLAHFEISS